MSDPLALPATRCGPQGRSARLLNRPEFYGASVRVPVRACLHHQADAARAWIDAVLGAKS